MDGPLQRFSQGDLRASQRASLGWSPTAESTKDRIGKVRYLPSMRRRGQWWKRDLDVSIGQDDNHLRGLAASAHHFLELGHPLDFSEPQPRTIGWAEAER